MASSREINILISGGSTCSVSSFLKIFEIVVLNSNLKDVGAFDLTLSEIEHWFEGDSNTKNDAKVAQTVVKGGGPPKAYVWRTKYGILRFIEIPAMNCTEEAIKYDKNFVDIVSCVKGIHGVIVLFGREKEEPFQRMQQHMSQISLLFGEYILKETLMCVFVMHDGLHGDTEVTHNVRRLMKSYNEKCPLLNERSFHFDHSWLKYIFERQNNNVHFSSEDLLNYTRSYKGSVREYMRLTCMLFESTVPYVCTNGQIVTNGRQILPALTDMLRILDDELIAIGNAVKYTVSTNEITIRNLTSEINIAMEDLEQTKTIVQYVKIPNKRLEVVKEEYGETKVVHDEVHDEEECQSEENETMGGAAAATESMSVVVRYVDEGVASGKNAEDVGVKNSNDSNGVLNQVKKAVVGSCLNGSIVHFGIAGFMVGTVVGVSIKQAVTRTGETPESSKKCAEMPENAATTKPKMDETSVKNIQRPTLDNIEKKNKSPGIRSRTIRVPKTREVAKVVTYVEEMPMLKVVKEIDPVLQTKVAELQQTKQDIEDQVESILKMYQHFTSEVKMVENFVKHLNIFLQEKFVFSNNEQVNTCKEKCLHVKNAHLHCAEDLNQELEELRKLKYVGSSVREALANSSRNKGTAFDTVEMRCGCLFDRVVQRYAIMTRLALKGFTMFTT